MALNFFVPSIGDVQLAPIWSHAGAPSSGAGGTYMGSAAKGDLLSDSTNATLYMCAASSSTSITWTQITIP